MVDHPKYVGLPDTDALEDDLLGFKTKKSFFFFNFDYEKRLRSNNFLNWPKEPIVNQNFNEEHDSLEDTGEAPLNKTEEVPVSFLSALKIPGVAEYALSYFALKVWVEKFSKKYKNKPEIRILVNPQLAC